MEETLRKSPRLWMISIYLFLVAIFLYVKPAAAFGQNGRIRPFGTGKKDSTIFPVWWWMFLFAAVSYGGVVYLLNYSL
jgi:drug/metabolite transporter (DMT)-like permease